MKNLSYDGNEPISKDLLAQITRRAEKAEEWCKIFGGFAISHWMRPGKLMHREKEAQELVTEIDLNIEKTFRRKIYSNFNSDAVLGEEFGLDNRDSQRILWIIDPIDGTTNFVNGIHLWCISVAICIGGTAVFGCVYQPTTGDIYSATIGKGAKRNGMKIWRDELNEIPDRLRFLVGLRYRINQDAPIKILSKIIRYNHSVRVLGSGALALCYIADNKCDVFVEDGIKIWDCAAGNLILMEANGSSNISKYYFNSPEPFKCIAAAKHLFPTAQNFIDLPEMP